jgi:lysyl-tRNA synthetase, class II
VNYTNKLVQQRAEKIEKLRELGINPYPYRYDPTHTSAQILADPDPLIDTVVKVAGRLMSIRGKGKAAFAHLQDVDGRIQVYVRKDFVGDEQFAAWKLMDIGDIVGIEGPIFRTRTEEITVQATDFTVLTKAIQTPPVVKERIVDGERETYDDINENTEMRYRHRSLDLIVNPDVRGVFRDRAKIIKTVRRVLDERGFIEVETPALQQVYGGASARPFRTHHNALDIDLFLKISPELYLKRLVVGGLDRVYDMTKNFRNEGIDRTHNPEFTMLELYQAYADFNDMMEITETLYSEAALAVKGSLKVTYLGHEIDLTPPWTRLKMTDAIKEYAGIDVFEKSDEELLKLIREKDEDFDEDTPRGLLINELFEQRVEDKLIGPVFITHHPRETIPLCKDAPDMPGFIERFEPYIAGSEIGNAYSEMNDPVRQRELLEEQAANRDIDGEIPPVDEDFLKAVETGMPPTGGLGIGIDRMVMVITNQDSIREVIAFPTLRPEKKIEE